VQERGTAMANIDRKSTIAYVVPHLSIGNIDQLADFFLAVRQFRPIDQLVPN
jgi:hypothetical protein